jgi:hypothetical protein
MLFIPLVAGLPQGKRIKICLVLLKKPFCGQS